MSHNTEYNKAKVMSYFDEKSAAIRSQYFIMQVIPAHFQGISSLKYLYIYMYARFFIASARFSCIIPCVRDYN